MSQVLNPPPGCAVVRVQNFSRRPAAQVHEAVLPWESGVCWASRGAGSNAHNTHTTPVLPQGEPAGKHRTRTQHWRHTTQQVAEGEIAVDNPMVSLVPGVTAERAGYAAVSNGLPVDGDPAIPRLCRICLQLIVGFTALNAGRSVVALRGDGQNAHTH